MINPCNKLICIALPKINNRLAEKVHGGRHHQLNHVLYIVGEILSGKVIQVQDSVTWAVIVFCPVGEKQDKIFAKH